MSWCIFSLGEVWARFLEYSTLLSVPFQFACIQGHSRKIFLRGQSYFPDFFPGVKCFFLVENYHFGRPKTNFSGFEKWEAKKKKGPLLIFPPSIFNFPPSLLQFSFFSSQFSSLFPFFLASFFPVCQQKFSSQKSLGALCPPACYATACNFLNKLKWWK